MVRFEERTDVWLKKMLSGEVSEKFYEKSFRMGDDTFHIKILILAPKLLKMFETLDIKKVALVLYYFKYTGSS